PALMAYGREGEECRRCKTSLERVVLSGRSAFYCPRCQPVARAQ
ncbi:MAG: DNA-formamidopyrimidine glycosylase, partial [Gemmatimonadetes bacterium]|nr:DNA-formamidopyrimidine glycosylase [Gemmatimonadota bacterium]